MNKQNKRFIFTILDKELKFSRYENSFLWLKDAGVALPVYNVDEPNIPLLASRNSNLFRLFSSDTGLLTSAYSVETKLELVKENSDVNNGAHFENAVAQELTSNGLIPYYCTKKKIGELDFLLEIDGKIVAIEVKSGAGYKVHNALDRFMEVPNYRIDKAYVLSKGNIEVVGNVTCLPVYMCYLIREKKMQSMIVDLDTSGL